MFGTFKMKDAQELFDQIEAFEIKGQSRKAYPLRERLLEKVDYANDQEFTFILDKLIKEKTTINGLSEAKEVEPYYRLLHEVTEKRIGNNSGLAALAKRKLARIFVIQGRYEEAVSLVEKALPVLTLQFGEDSYEVREALGSEIAWCKFFDPAKAKALIEKEWLDHPLCEHLKPIEDYLRECGVKMWREKAISRPEVKLFVCAYLDVDSMRGRLNLNSCVENFEDPPGPHSCYLKGFTCGIHHHFIAGDYEKSKEEPIIS